MLVGLFATSLAIAVAAFGAGLLPLVLNRTCDGILDQISASIAGVLLSTALVLILPEAIEHSEAKPALIGPVILVGFMSLLVLDAVCQSLTQQTNCGSQGSASYFSEEESTVVMDSSYSDKSIKSMICKAFTNSTTVGLLLHCLSDGVLLTSSLMTSDTSSQIPGLFMIIAIFVHKLPAAFSLSTILLNQGVYQSEMLVHLGLFALAAPVGAWISYFCLLIVGTSNTSDSVLLPSILLFSTGAFLYVSFHTLSQHHDSPNSILWTAAGSLLPFIALPFSE